MNVVLEDFLCENAALLQQHEMAIESSDAVRCLMEIVAALMHNAVTVSKEAISAVA